MKLILASTSVYRKELFTKLGLAFSCVEPEVDEENLKSELLRLTYSPEKIAEALSFEKGNSVFKNQMGDCLVISGDQLIAFENQIVGKPLSFEKAVEQLTLLNGKTHQLITAITLIAPQLTVKFNHISLMKMKNLSRQELINYAKFDNPVDCSGSYKIEKYGITLFEAIECDDFTAIQGLPMLWLSNYLKGMNYEFFTA